ncbi:MAG TPA: LysE family translocator [Stellaceae bacterium]|nr:LysE family translocator [Stellaceae bacterium]
MSWSAWGLFCLTEAVLCLTPGPAVLLVVSQGVRRGTGASISANIGILSGNLVYFLLSATGLGAVLLASYDLFFAIKWIGAAYLVWLGLGALFGKSSALAMPADRGTAEPASTGVGRMIGNGAVLQLTNPKALVFFTALLPQFVDPAGSIAGQIAILAATSVVIEFVILAGYGLLAGRATRLARRPGFARITNWMAGSLLISAGVGMATLRRN